MPVAMQPMQAMHGPHCTGSSSRGGTQCPRARSRIHIFLSSRPPAGCAAPAQEGNRSVARKGSAGPRGHHAEVGAVSSPLSA